jgi:CRP/FNR family transcriptional regulator, cyclic AMP receptor protein
MDQFVARAAIFRPIEPGVAAAVTARLESVHYLPGRVIFAEGEPGDRLYIIAAGKVKINRDRPHRCSCDGDGSIRAAR